MLVWALPLSCQYNELGRVTLTPNDIGSLTAAVQPGATWATRGAGQKGTCSSLEDWDISQEQRHIKTSPQAKRHELSLQVTF